MRTTTAWVILLLAGVFEMIWAVGLKYTDGFTRLWPSVGTLIAMVVSLWLLSLAMRTLPLGTAYAAWTGIGAVSIALFGMIWLGEPVTLARIGCIGLILAGVVGLKVIS